MVTLASPTDSGNDDPQSGLSNSDESISRSTGQKSAPDLVKDVADGAHQTIDRLAEKVTPHIERLQESMAGTSEMLDGRADQLRELTDEWMETLRVTVREHPLASVGAALAFGLLIARLSR